MPFILNPTGADGADGADGDRYQTTSTTSFTLGTSGSQTIVLADLDVSYSVGQSIIVANDVDHHQHGTVSSYNAATGQLVFVKDKKTGSGTFASWTVNIDGATGATGPAGTSVTVHSQVSVTGKYYSAAQISPLGNNSAFPGACVPIKFSTATIIDKMGLYTFVSYTGSNLTYRLGIYNNTSNFPSSLLVDAGTLTYSNPTAVGIHELTLASPVTLAADTLYWLACSHANATSAFAAQCGGNLPPVVDYGLGITSSYYSTGAVGFHYGVSGATALADPFVVNATFPTTAYTPLVYVKVQ